jgi:hypothetical protein
MSHDLHVVLTRRVLDNGEGSTCGLSFPLLDTRTWTAWKQDAGEGDGKMVVTQHGTSERKPSTPPTWTVKCHVATRDRARRWDEHDAKTRQEGPGAGQSA